MHSTSYFSKSIFKPWLTKTNVDLNTRGSTTTPPLGKSTEHLYSSTQFSLMQTMSYKHHIQRLDVEHLWTGGGKILSRSERENHCTSTVMTTQQRPCLHVSYLKQNCKTEPSQTILSLNSLSHLSMGQRWRETERRGEGNLHPASERWRVRMRTTEKTVS